MTLIKIILIALNIDPCLLHTIDLNPFVSMGPLLQKADQRTGDAESERQNVIVVYLGLVTARFYDMNIGALVKPSNVFSDY